MSLNAAILKHITALRDEGELDDEALEQAHECLGAVFDVDDGDAPDSHTLAEIFRVGIQTLNSFAKFVELLQGKGFFDGAEAGTPEFEKRMAQLRTKYEAKYGDVDDATFNAVAAPPKAAAPAATSASSSSLSSSSTKVASEADKAAAVALKNEGNALFQAGKAPQAVAKYTAAIELDASSHVYFANRAAAYLQLDQAAKAVTDCEAAIALTPSYMKAHYRLGTAHMKMKSFEKAVAAFGAAVGSDSACVFVTVHLCCSLDSENAVVMCARSAHARHATLHTAGGVGTERQAGCGGQEARRGGGQARIAGGGAPRQRRRRRRRGCQPPCGDDGWHGWRRRRRRRWNGPQFADVEPRHHADGAVNDGRWRYG
jgi:tetratricopeptide (TPR) repeat protein